MFLFLQVDMLMVIVTSAGKSGKSAIQMKMVWLLSKLYGHPAPDDEEEEEQEDCSRSGLQQAPTCLQGLVSLL